MNQLKPFLSIIIPIFKIKEEYLRACFDSLIAQDCKKFCVIAVDDGSPDNSGAICDEYAEKDNRFMVIHQENGGVSVARNNGIKAANTEWITFVDPDDWVEPNHVSTLINAANEHGNDSDIICFDYVQEFANKTVIKQLMNSSGVLDEVWVRNLRIAPFNYFVVDGRAYEYETNTIWNKMYRTSLIKDNKLWFDPKARKGQDVIFNAECFQLTDRYYYVKEPLYHYRYLQESATNRFNTKAQYYNEVAFDNYERIIKKFNLPQEYKEAFYARVVTRLYSCMRLYYFHPENTKSNKEVKRELDETLSKYPYNECLEKVKHDHLAGTQKIFVFFLKRRQYGVLRVLVNGRLWLKKIKGSKLKA